MLVHGGNSPFLFKALPAISDAHSPAQIDRVQSLVNPASAAGSVSSDVFVLSGRKIREVSAADLRRVLLSEVQHLVDIGTLPDSSAPLFASLFSGGTSPPLDRF